MKINGHEFEISDRDKVFFPEVGLTKGDLIDYYHDVADVMVPHMKRYGASMQRFPDGIQEEGWYAKDAPDYFPDWIERINFPKKEGGSFNAPVIDSRAALVYLANQAVLTMHLYLSRADDLEHPDKMVYDLDPPEGSEDFAAVREAALAIRDLMDELDLRSWVQTTGSMGFHVIVPLDRDWDFDAVKAFADDAALVVVRRYPEKFTLEQRKKKRKGRIYLDTYRNSYGATAVAPYAVRARPEAPVATPLDWDELAEGANPRDWTVENIRNRLGQKEDPWAGMMRHAQSLEPRQETLKKLLDQEGPAPEED